MVLKHNTVVALGVFDGVHLGHQALLHALVRLARGTRSLPVVLTFLDHPDHVVKHTGPVPFLVSRQETFERLLEGGAEEVHFLPFTRAFARKTPGEFIQWLQSQYRLRGVVVGENFCFGRGGSGKTPFLQGEGRRLGFKVVVVPQVRRSGKVVSSTWIRKLLQGGKLKEANRLLGRPYELEGRVVHGRHVGHQIGYPTANLSGIPQVLPRDGVYACRVGIRGKSYRAAMNLGRRPTFRDDDHHRSAEVHLMGYRGRPLYGSTLKVDLVDFMRGERKFSSPQALARQIARDLEAVRKIPRP